MKNLSLHFLKKKKRLISGSPYYEAELLVNGKIGERPMIPTCWWSKEDYEKQWKEGLERLKTYDSSCLITAVNDPRIMPWIELFGLYKKKDKIIIQSFGILADTYRERIGIKPFTPETCYNYIPKESKGHRIDQWIALLDD